MRSCIIRRVEKLEGTVTVPPSKSHTLRAILFASCAEGESCIYNPLHSPDTDALIEACCQFGASIEIKNDSLVIRGTSGIFKKPQQALYCGNSGIMLRFVTALASLSEKPITLTGDRSLRTKRPMKELISALQLLGVKVQSHGLKNFAPLTVEGPVQSFSTELDGADSQPVSALLTLGCLLDKPLEIYVKNPGETPWIDLTLSWLKRLGVAYERERYHHYQILGRGGYQGFTYTVPGDVSSAAFPATAAVITGSTVKIKGVQKNDPQGDSQYFSILQQMGAQVEFSEKDDSLSITPKHLKGITVDINSCIDAIVPLAVAASCAEGETVIKNGAVARTKECDRLKALTEELTKMGVNIQETEDGLRVQGGALKGAQVKSHEDHRMALSLMTAALNAEGETEIQDINCIDKTYPNFLESLQQLGADFHAFDH